MRVPIDGHPGCFTEKFETPEGPLSPTEIDRRCAEISGKILRQEDTREDRQLREKLSEIRRCNLVPLPPVR